MYKKKNDHYDVNTPAHMVKTYRKEKIYKENQQYNVIKMKRNDIKLNQINIYVYNYKKNNNLR